MKDLILFEDHKKVGGTQESGEPLLGPARDERQWIKGIDHVFLAQTQGRYKMRKKKNLAILCLGSALVILAKIVRPGQTRSEKKSDVVP